MVFLEAAKVAAISYCEGQTGIKKENLDKYEDITIAVLALISDMWDNRSVKAEKSNLNPVIATILSMHCENLLPTPDCEVI